jgi:hypothetical protein
MRHWPTPFPPAAGGFAREAFVLARSPRHGAHAARKRHRYRLAASPSNNRQQHDEEETVMRTYDSFGLALLMVLAFIFTISSEALAADRFTFARPPAPESAVDPKDRLSVQIDRWSTDAERDQVIASIKGNGEEKLLNAFRDVGRLGTLRWPGGLEYAVRYARREGRSDGGTDLVLVVDRPLWMWWDSTRGSTPYPFSVVQIRLGKDGTGEGRVSLGVPVVSDTTLGVALSDYAKAPAVFTDVRREHDAT